MGGAPHPVIRAAPGERGRGSSAPVVAAGSIQARSLQDWRTGAGSALEGLTARPSMRRRGSEDPFAVQIVARACNQGLTSAPRTLR